MINIELLDKFISILARHSKDMKWNILKNNDLLYYYLLYTDENSADLDKYNNLLNDRYNMIKTIDTVLCKNKVEFVTIKSFPSFPYLDNDIDVLVSDIKRAKKILEMNGFEYKWNLSELREPDKFFMSSLDSSMLCHLHENLSWNNVVAIDRMQVIKRSIRKNINNNNIIIPSNEDEILIAAAHSIFENYHIKFSDVIYFKSLNKEIDWDYIIEQSKKHFWYEGLRLYLSGLARIYKYLGEDYYIPKYIITGSFHFNTRKYPCFYKYSTLLTKVYLRRILFLISRVKIKEILWECYVYFVVGPFWKYFRTKRKIDQLYRNER